MSNSPRKSNSKRNPPPEVDTVWFTRTMLTFELSDGRAISVPLSFYPALLVATERVRLEYEISGSAVYWSGLELKLTAGDLLAGKRRS
jgi:hypothetical protein